MPTVPRNAAESHKAREIAESFGAEAERYDRARPRYPDALIQRIAAESPGPEFLVAGSGTGIDARQFQAAGCQVLGVEPDARMAAFAEHSGVPTEVATFEDWDPAGRTFDAVAAGMAWHWIDPVAGAAKAAEALRPGGRLAVFWYVSQGPSELSDKTGAVFRRVLPDLPYAPTAVSLEAYSAFFTKAENGIAEAGGFGEPERWRYDWSRTYTRDEYLDFVPTAGGMGGRLPPEQLAELLAGLGEAVDAIGGSFTMEFATVAVTVTRKG